MASACSEITERVAGRTLSDATAAALPVPMLFVPEDAHAAVFEDHDLGIDVIQLYAHEDSSGTAVLLQFPAAFAANAGSVSLSPATDPTVQGWFATSAGHHDLYWQFALHDATLSILTAGTSEGATIAVALAPAAFVFENDHGHQNPAITALIGAMDPPLSAVLDHEPLIH